MAYTALDGRFGGQGLRVEIRPRPKVRRTLPKGVADLARHDSLAACSERDEEPKYVQKRLFYTFIGQNEENLCRNGCFTQIFERFRGKPGMTRGQAQNDTTLISRMTLM